MKASARQGRLLALEVGLPVALLLAVGAVIAVDFATGGANPPPMDLVFILDEGAGLAETANQVKSNWLRTARSLNMQGSDCRFAVIPCHPDSKRIPRITLTSDIGELERRLAGAVSESDPPSDLWPDTDCLQALEDVLELEFREDASPVVFLTTRSIADDEQRLSEIAKRYRERAIKPIIQAHESDQAFFRPLYRHGGQFFTLAGENRTEPSETESDIQRVDVGSLLSNVNQGTPGQFPKAEKLIAGVKVKGQIALVCDISGSMYRDFPPLVHELRSKFPKDTPLILVVGCKFHKPNERNQRPVALSDSGQSMAVAGVDFTSDPHVYFNASTTDAIIMAIKQFRRDTVMFNNDLQDGGSMQAITAFEELWNRRPFTLSGRSLNCDAPQFLQDFIKKTGGDFRVDPINRRVSPATTWGI